MNTIAATPSPVLITASMVWDDLNDTERLRLHSAAQQPGCDLTKKKLPPVALTLLGRGETSLHAVTVDAINQLAHQWHVDAGRL